MALCYNTESIANFPVVQTLKTAVVFWLCKEVSLLDLYREENKTSHPMPTTLGGIVTTPCANLGNLSVAESNSNNKRDR